jgi:hypothetical protein
LVRVVTVTVEPRGESTRALHGFLIQDDELRGHVHLGSSPGTPGSLGITTDSVLAYLGSGSAGAAFASVLVSWIRHRTSNTRLVARRDDGLEIELTAERTGSLSAADVRELIADVARMFDPSSHGPDASGVGEAGET